MFHQRFPLTSTSFPAFPVTTFPSLPVISVFGLSRAGLMMTATLASLGYRVIGVDGDPDKTEALEQGRCDLHKPGLEEMLDHGRIMGRIMVSDDILTAVGRSEITLVTQGYGLDAFGRRDPYPLMVMGRTLGAAIRLKGAAHTVMLHAPDAPELCDGILAPALAQGFGRDALTGYRLCAMPAQLRDEAALGAFRHVLADFLPTAR